MAFTVTAFMCVYNEADIIPWTIKNLIAQGVGVHVIDNWSSDGSDEIAREFPLVGFERFPAEGPSKYYSWRFLLQRVEQLVTQSPATWVCHHDADEIRRSPRAGETLAAAFARVDSEGYDAVNFKAYHFMPTDDTYRGDPEKHFCFYEPTHDTSTSKHIKAWKNLPGRKLLLANNGGHVAVLRPRIHPELFILKHYPVRTSQQGERKIIHERMERYDPVEIERQWHVQYNTLARKRDWIKDPAKLTEWKETVCV